MSEWKAKRFWKQADVVAREGGHTVELDGRPIKTPAKRALIMPTQVMAEAVAVEWQAQEEIIDPGAMPCTRTVNAAIDKVATQHAEVADMIAAYADSDLLCYRADAPTALIAREAAAWDPMLDWAADALDARLLPRTGVIHQPQDELALATLSLRTHDLTAFELAAFHDLVSLTGSLVLGFAAALDAHSADALWKISRLDEIWQAEQWGSDTAAEEAAALKRASFLHAKAMFDLCRTN